MNELELEKYWNEKTPTQPIIYAGRSITNATTKQTTNLNVDVRNLVTPYDTFLQDIIVANNLKADSYDETMIRIQRYVCSHLKYVGDDQSIGVVEYWQFPFETIATGIGDCEDGAILIASLAINAGIPAFRVRVTAGFVKPGEFAELGGHGYCTYLRESNDWIVVDWCYLADPQVEIKDKPIMKDNPFYKEVWFSFNHLFSFGDKSFIVDK